MSGVETTETAPSELIILQDNHGCAEIGGVFFDFRHPLLTEDWRPSYGLGWAGTSSLKLLAPVHVVFPWTRYEPTPALDELAGLSGMAALRWTVEHGPSGHADVGDRVFIRSVRRVVIGDEFEAEPDGTYLSVRYAVERPCGRIDRIRGRSSYLHRDRDWGDSTILSWRVLHGRSDAGGCCAEVDAALSPWRHGRGRRTWRTMRTQCCALLGCAC